MNGTPVALNGTLVRRLLAALLITENQPVPDDELADLLWPGEVKALRVVAWRLRTALGPAADRLERTPTGYRFLLPEQTDHHHFTALALTGLHQNPPETAIKTLTAAIDLWHGTPWPDLAPADPPATAGETSAAGVAPGEVAAASAPAVRARAGELAGTAAAGSARAVEGRLGEVAVVSARMVRERMGTAAVGSGRLVQGRVGQAAGTAAARTGRLVQGRAGEVAVGSGRAVQARVGEVAVVGIVRRRYAGERARLWELYEAALEEREAARLAVGSAWPAVRALSRLVADSPYRERRWELLAQALCATGDPARAAAELRRYRRLLADDLGLDPSPHLLALERRLTPTIVHPRWRWR